MTEIEITKNTIIADLIKVDPKKIMEVFFKRGLYCVGCPIAAGETIEQAAISHGLDVDELIKEIKDRLKEE